MSVIDKGNYRGMDWAVTTDHELILGKEGTHQICDRRTMKFEEDWNDGYEGSFGDIVDLDWPWYDRDYEQIEYNSSYARSSCFYNIDKVKLLGDVFILDDEYGDTIFDGTKIGQDFLEDEHLHISNMETIPNEIIKEADASVKGDPSSPVIYAGSLRKDNVNYYFEVKEDDAYIEKTFVVGGMREDEHYGHFTLEQARKCWKALKAKGFTEYIDPTVELQETPDDADEMEDFMQRYGYDPAMEDLYGSMGVDYVYDPETGSYGPDMSGFEPENEDQFE